MTRAAKSQPSTPDQIAKLKAAGMIGGSRPIMAANNNSASPEDPVDASVLRARRAEAARLKAQGAIVKSDKRTGKITNATRYDVFAMLASRRGKPDVEGQLGKPALESRSYDAFRDHEATLHIALGHNTPERRPDYIRASAPGAPGQNINQAMIEASEIVAETGRRLGPVDSALLDALMQPGAALLTRWRAVVQHYTGEDRAECQASRIRALGSNLTHARKVALEVTQLDRERRRALAAND